MVTSSLACLLTGVLAVLAPPSSPAESIVRRGKFVTLSEALMARDLAIKPDPEPIAKQVVLLAEDGTIIPLLSDDASRALFLDERLRNRAGEIQGRRFAGLPYSRSSHSRSSTTVGFKPPSIIAKFARSAYVTRRFALAVKARWNCACSPVSADQSGVRPDDTMSACEQVFSGVG